MSAITHPSTKHLHKPSHVLPKLKSKNWFDTEKRIQFRTKLQQAAKQYLIADQRLGHFCEEHPQYSAVKLSQHGYAWAKSKLDDTETIDNQQAVELAKDAGKKLQLMNTIVEDLVADGVSVFACLEVTREILDPTGIPNVTEDDNQDEDFCLDSDDLVLEDETDEKQILAELSEEEKSSAEVSEEISKLDNQNCL